MSYDSPMSNIMYRTNPVGNNSIQLRKDACGARLLFDSNFCIN